MRFEAHGRDRRQRRGGAPRRHPGQAVRTIVFVLASTLAGWNIYEALAWPGRQPVGRGKACMLLNAIAAAVVGGTTCSAGASTV